MHVQPSGGNSDILLHSVKQWQIRKHFQDVSKVLIAWEISKSTMLHLQNDAFSTVLAFHAPSELLNFFSVPHSCTPNELQLSFEWLCERQTDNDAISNFGPPKQLGASRCSPCSLACLLHFRSLFLTCLSSCLFGPFLLFWLLGSLLLLLVFVTLWPFGPQSFGPLAFWLFGLCPLWPLALWSFCLFGPFASLGLFAPLAPLWPPFGPFGPLALAPSAVGLSCASLGLSRSCACQHVVLPAKHATALFCASLPEDRRAEAGSRGRRSEAGGRRPEVEG